MDPKSHARTYDKWKAYGQSKTANALFAVELDRRRKAHGIRGFAVHPGRIVSTALGRHLEPEEIKAAMAQSRTGLKSIAQGAATSVWCAVSAELDGKGGVYCADCHTSEVVADTSDDSAGVRAWATDPEKAAALWQLSEDLVRRKI